MQAEFRQVKKGMIKPRVSTIFGTAGKRQAIARSGGYLSEIRSYRTCPRFSAASLAFDKRPGGQLKMRAKFAIWVG